MYSFIASFKILSASLVKVLVEFIISLKLGLVLLINSLSPDKNERTFATSILLDRTSKKFFLETKHANYFALGSDKWKELLINQLILR